MTKQGTIKTKKTFHVSIILNAMRKFFNKVIKNKRSIKFKNSKIQNDSLKNSSMIYIIIIEKKSLSLKSVL